MEIIMADSKNGYDNKIAPEYLENLIKKIADKEYPKDYSVEIKSVPSDGANYMSNLYTAKVTGVGGDLELFAKTSNAPAELRGILATREIFDREVFALTELADVYAKMQQEHNIPEKERYRFPKLLGSSLVEFEEAIVMRNMTSIGYTVYERQKSMDWEFGSEYVKALAKYHALSFAHKIEYPEMFESTVQSKNEIFNGNVKDDDSQNDYFAKIWEASLSAVDKRNREKLEKFITKAKDKNFVVEHLRSTKNSILAHGDVKLSNALVKYRGDRVEDLILIDYQTIYFGSPLNDLSYLLLAGSDEKFRKHHLDDLIRLYYDTLSDFLEKLGKSVDEIFPEDEFYSEMKYKMEYGFMYALIMLPLLTVDVDEVPQLSDLMIPDRPAVSENNSLYKKRLNGLIDDLVTRGVL